MISIFTITITCKAFWLILSLIYAASISFCKFLQQQMIFSKMLVLLQFWNWNCISCLQPFAWLSTEHSWALYTSHLPKNWEHWKGHTDPDLSKHFRVFWLTQLAPDNPVATQHKKVPAKGISCNRLAWMCIIYLFFLWGVTFCPYKTKELSVLPDENFIFCGTYLINLIQPKCIHFGI